MKIKLWFILVFCSLCFSLVVQPLFVGALSEQNQSRSVQQAKAKLKSDQSRSTQQFKTNKNKSNKKQSPQKTSGSRFDALGLGQRQRPEQSTGIILSFHKYPSEEAQSKISETLKKEGLKLTKKFQSFKALVFSWKKLKTQKRAKNVCRKLSQLKNLNYCEPDALLHPNNTSALGESETEAGSTCTVDCIHPQTLDQQATSEIQNIIQVAVPKEPCELLSSQHRLKDGKLSDYWAQEMIGADLLKEELEKAPPLPEDKFLVAVFDSVDKFSDHGIYVQNLISHDRDQAVLPGLNASQIQFFQTKGASQYMSAVENIARDFKQDIQNNSIADNVQTAAEKLLSQRKIPSFINNSMIWIGAAQTIYEAMSRIHPSAILVQAAGNDYPYHPLSSGQSQFSKNFDSILVGSLSPSGLVSGFSNEGEEVHILAPSDKWITSVDNDGKYKKFGGTSGAAPLVTGSLAGFEWLSGYHPTPAEAKLLLEQTAIPTIHSAFENPRRNGNGMLNAYKLGMVGKRLKEKCNDSEECFQTEIRNPTNYEFPIDETSILEQVKEVFPECSDQEETPVTCEDKKAVFKKLRQALLLDIENISLLEKLHCIYTQEGFSENALNIEAAIVAVTEDEDQLLKLSQRSKIEISNIASRIGGKGGLKILEELAKDEDPDVRERVVIRAGEIGGRGALKIFEKLAADEDPGVRKEVALSARHIDGDEALKIFEKLATDEEPGVRKAVASGARHIGDKASKIFEKLAADEEPGVREKAAYYAGFTGGDKALKIFEKLATDEDPGVRREVAVGAGIMGAIVRRNDGSIDNEVLRIFEKLATDEDPDVRMGVAEGAGIMGKEVTSKILEGLAQDPNERVRNLAIAVINDNVILNSPLRP